MAEKQKKKRKPSKQLSDQKISINLSDLRKQRLEIASAKELKARVYSPDGDPKDSDQDSGVSIYGFKLDATKAQTLIADSKIAAIKKSRELKSKILQSQISSYQAELAKITFSDSSLASAKSDDVLNSALKTLVPLCDQKVQISNLIVKSSLALLQNEVDFSLESAHALALVMANDMKDKAKDFFPIYYTKKTYLSLVDEFRKKCEAIKKAHEAIIDERSAIILKHSKFLIALHKGDEEIKLHAKKAEITCRIYKVDKLAAINKALIHIESEKENARTIVFLGIESKKFARLNRRNSVNIAEASSFSAKSSDEKSLHEISYLEAKTKLENILVADEKIYEAEIASHEPAAKEWAKYGFDLDKDDDINTKDPRIEAIIKTLEEKLSICDLAIKKCHETPFPGIDKNTLKNKEEEIAKAISLTSEIKDIKQANELIKKGLNAVKSNWTCARNQIKDYTHASKSRIREISDIVEEKRRLRLKACSEIYDYRTHSQVETEKSKQFDIYFNSKRSIEKLLQDKEIEENYYEEVLKSIEDEREFKTAAVKNKFDQKVGYILDLMEVRRYGVAYGRTLNHEKLINREYDNLAKKQNKTKSVNKAYNEALTAVEVSYKSDKDYINATHTKKLEAIKIKTLYHETVIKYGLEYAKAFTKTYLARIAKKNKTEQSIIDLEHLKNIDIETVERTEKSWDEKVEHSAKQTRAVRESLNNKTYLIDTEAIKIRRFSLKYTPKRMFIRIFVIVVVASTLGLIKLVLPSPLVGVITGVILALAVELLKYFFSPICYVLPDNKGGLMIYSSQGELMFALSDGDIVNEYLVTNRSFLSSFLPGLVGFQVIVESGADLFRFAIRGHHYKKLLLKQLRALKINRKIERKAAKVALKAEKKQRAAYLKQVKPTYIK